MPIFKPVDKDITDTRLWNYIVLRTAFVSFAPRLAGTEQRRRWSSGTEFTARVLFDLWLGYPDGCRSAPTIGLTIQEGRTELARLVSRPNTGRDVKVAWALYRGLDVEKITTLASSSLVDLTTKLAKEKRKRMKEIKRKEKEKQKYAHF